MAKFKITNIEWDITNDTILETFDDMTCERAADELEIPTDTYANMTTEERHDYILDYYHHRNCAAADLFGLPDEADVPDTYGYESKEEDFEDFISEFTDEKGFCIVAYNVEEI